jgi:hypothetical protein
LKSVPENASPLQDADPVRWLVEWSVVQPGVKDDVERLARKLLDGWEPFAVTVGRDAFTYHLRRQIDGSNE